MSNEYDWLTGATEARAALASAPPPRAEVDPRRSRAEIDAAGAAMSAPLTNFLTNRAPNPDAAGKANRLARSTGLPADTVERNLPEIERDVDFRALSGIVQQNPTLARWAADPRNAAVAPTPGDVGELTSLQARLRALPAQDFNPTAWRIAQLTRGTLRGTALVDPSVGSIARGVKASFLTGAANAGVGIDLMLSDAFGTGDADRDMLLRDYRRNQSRADAAAPEFESSTARGLYGGLASLAQAAPAIAAGVAVGVANPFAGTALSLSLMGGQTSALAYGKYRERGGTAGEAALGAAIEGSVEAATELLPMGFLVKNLGRAGFKDFVAGFVGRELPSEQLATFLQDASDTAIANPDKTWAEFWSERPEAAYQTLLATAVMAGAAGAANVGVNKALAVAARYGFEDQRAAGAEQGQALLNDLGKMAEASKVRERDPAAFEAWVQAAAEGGPAEQVHVTASALVGALEQAGVTREQLAELSPAIAEQLDVALATGGDVVVPIGEYATNIAATELHQAIADHVKLNAGGMTKAEADVFMQTRGDQLQADMAKAAAIAADDERATAQVRAVRDDVAAQLATVEGMSPDAARSYGALHAAFFSTLAATTGQDVQTLYARFGARIVGAKSAAPQASAMVTQPAAGTPAEGVAAPAAPVAPVGQTAPQGVEGNSDGQPDTGTAPGAASGRDDAGRSEPARDGGSGRSTGGGLARLEGAPTVRGFNGPIPAIVAVAESYAASVGIPYRRQVVYAKADPERGARIAAAYEAMAHAPGDPEVAAAYAELMRQTRAQYDALVAAGFVFYFTDLNTDAGLAYLSSPWHAMRELQDASRMGVYPTEEGFGTREALDVSDNPLLADTGIEWPYGGPDGPTKRVLANDLFRAVHDAFGHGLEGAGFRAQGEENAWLSHTRLYTGGALAAATTETRGQNSWLNFGPYGETNRTAGLEDTVFADQKVGLLPAWAWQEGMAEATVVVDNGTLKQDATPYVAGEGFYSALARAVETSKLPKAPPAQWKATLRKTPGVKQEELEWTGLPDWLDAQEEQGTKSLRREDVLAYVQSRGVQVREVYRTDDRDKLWANEGFTAQINSERQKAWMASDEYREALLAETRGKAGAVELAFEQWQQRVWRFLREDAERQAGYGFEPLASRYVTGEEHGAGYVELLLTLPPGVGGNPARPPTTHWEEPGVVVHVRFDERLGPSGERVMMVHEIQSDWHGESESNSTDAAPFKGMGYAKLAMRRIITYAAEQGYDRVAWIRPEQFNGGHTGGDDRGAWFYARNLINLTNDILKTLGGKRVEWLDRIAGMAFRNPVEVAEENLRVALAERDARETGTYNLAPDEEGYAEYDDEDLDDIITALQKKVEDAALIPAGNPGFEITDAMRDAARKGLPLFQKGPSPRGTYQPSTRTITLLESANPSTFLHETGHYFLDVLTQIAAEPGAPLTVMQDVQTLLSWFGVADLATWNAMSIDEQRPHHETFARGFEAHLFTGRTPTPELRPIFVKFRAFLRAVYRSLRDLNVTLTPEVSAVMDRLVAPADAVVVAQEAAGAEALFTSAAEAGMTPAEFDSYRRQVDAATADADATLTRRSMRDMRWFANAKTKALAALQRRNKTLRDDMRATVEAEVMAEPVNRARTFLKRGLGADGQPVQGPHKLSIDEIDTMFADRPKLFVDELKRKLGYGKAGMLAKADSGNAIHPAQVAEALGFPNAEAMLDALANAEDPSARIEALTDQRMLEEHGDIADADAMQREAEAAIANDMRGRVLATELAALAKQTGNLNVLSKAARDVAGRIVGGLKASSLKAAIYKYDQAAARAGRAALAALAKGNVAEAAVEKRNQLLNFHLAKAAREAQAAFPKHQRLYTRIATAADDRIAKTRDMALVNAARALLASYGFGRVKNDPAGYLAILKREDPTRYAEIEPMIADLLGDERTELDDLTVDQLVALHDTIAGLWASSRRNKQIEIDGKLVDLEAVVDGLVPTLEALAGSAAPRDRAPTDGERAMRTFQGLFAALKRVEAWCDALGAGFTKAIFRPVSEAAVRYRLESAAKLAAYRTLFDGIKDRLAPSPIAAPELGYTFSGRAELLHALLHSGAESNLRKLLLGRGWGDSLADGVVDTSRWDAFVARLHADGTLTRADYDFAQGVWDLLDTLKGGAQRAHLAVYGRYFGEIAPRTLTTPFGDYRGGYVPAMADSFLVADAALRREAEKLEDNPSNMFPAPGSGFTKSRVENYAVPLTLDLRALSRHIDKVLLFTHMAAPVRDVMRLLGNRKFSEALAAHDPVAQTDLLLPWLNRAARQTVDVPLSGEGGRGMDTFWREVRSRTGMQIMALNVVNTLQQITGLSLAALKVKPRYLSAGLWQVVRAPREALAAARAASPYMVDRSDNQAFETRQALEDLVLGGSRLKSMRDWAVRNTYVIQVAFQNLIDPVIWHGAYAQADAQGLGHNEAVRQADAAIRMTQGAMSPEDISRFESGNAFVRLFTQFYNYFGMWSNLLGAEYAKVARGVGLKRGAGRLLFIYTAGYMLPAVLAETIAQLGRGGLEDEDDDGYLDDTLALFFSAQARTATAMVPVAGQFVNAVIASFNDKPYDDRLALSPAVSTFETVAGLPKQLVALFDEEQDVNVRKLTRDVLSMLGYITGVPLGALGRPLGYLAGVANDDIEPTSTADAARGTVTGNPSEDSRV